LEGKVESPICRVRIHLRRCGVFTATLYPSGFGGLVFEAFCEIILRKANYPLIAVKSAVYILSVRKKGCGKWNSCEWKDGKNGERSSMALGGRGKKEIRYPKQIGGASP
jgi:hypothetical protein